MRENIEIETFRVANKGKVLLYIECNEAKLLYFVELVRSLILFCSDFLSKLKALEVLLNGLMRGIIELFSDLKVDDERDPNR
jgi:hypothetical protein